MGEGKYSVVAAPGSAPDFESSDEVLTCTWMFSFSVGAGEREERPASSWFAFFIVSTEETRKRFGMLEARGLHLSVKVSLYPIFQPMSFLKTGHVMCDLYSSLVMGEEHRKGEGEVGTY